MKTKSITALAAIFAVSLLFQSELFSATDYKITGSAEYRASSTMSDFSGKNESVNGAMSLDAPGGKICISLASWNSGNARRDDHTGVMFEVSKFPQSCFDVQSITEKGGRSVLNGTLTLHGTAKPVQFTGVINKSGSEFTLECDSVLLLTDFGLKAPVLMGIRVHNEVKVFIKIRGQR